MTDIPTFLACPECQTPTLVPAEADEKLPAPFDSRRGLSCSNCDRFYPVIDRIFVLWSDQLKSLQLADANSEEASLSDKVKRANIQIYDEVTSEYGEHHDGSQPYTQTQLFLKAIANEFRNKQTTHEDSVVVDVGCAIGAGLDVGSFGYRYRVGVDISLGNLRAVADRGHIPVLADAERLPFAADSIDLMTCFATLHHFPDPQKYLVESRRCLRAGGVALIAGEPSNQSMHMGPLAKLAWDSRKPVYRFLGRFSSRFYMHRNRDQQELNDLAEVNRSAGGFSEDDLRGFLSTAGFEAVKVFYGTDPSGFQRYSRPPWQHLVLRTLSFRNPLKRSNWMNLSAVGRADD